MEKKLTTWNLNEQLYRQYYQTVRRVVETLIKPDSLKQDLLFALLLVIMKDNDFLQLEEIGRNVISTEDFLLSRKQKDIGMYESVLVLNGFQNTPLKIIASPLNDAILINATIPELYKETYSICLKVSNYVLTSDLGIPANFYNLNELVVTLKDKILNPIKSGILNYHSYPSANLSGLPEDIVDQIAMKLHIKDVIALSNSCKRMHMVINNERLWSDLFKRDFRDKHEIGGSDYMNKYKEEYISRRDAKFQLLSNIGSESFRQFAELPDYMRHGSDSRWEVIL
ncbi:F-box only protein 7-like [Achroia grisella]|uniref:F-box only protein 7-like n=1 Tax=Achroia grisella TaxID=688607 RepID=UPI0027D1EFDB|nr:F-box only protein 7-like [Achroia grisella]